MDEEEKKIRFIKIVERLRVISYEISVLENHLDNLKIVNDSALNINGTGVGVNNIINAKNYINSASNVINNTIVPRLEEKINS